MFAGSESAKPFLTLVRINRSLTLYFKCPRCWEIGPLNNESLRVCVRGRQCWCLSMNEQAKLGDQC